jgi:DNA replication ATP-dependent helicase Dna2
VPTDHLILLQQLKIFIRKEYEIQRHELEKQWALPLTQRVRQGYAIEALSLRSLKGNALKLNCQSNDSRFRDGDLLVLHRGNPKGPESVQCILDYDDETSLDLLITDGKTFLLKEHPEGWIIDESMLDLSSMFLDALDQVSDSLRGREYILPLINGELAPNIDWARYEHAWEAALTEGLNETQCEALANAYATDLAYLIQGPPGTGKTFVLAHLARMLVADGFRVLVTALTHRAINNALNKIYELDPALPLCKVGQESAARDLLPPNYINFAEADFAYAEGGYIVGATPFATRSQRLSNVEFDVVIFDEASQITLPLAIMGMLAGGRYIFIGDDRQLPPVVSAGATQVGRTSIFGYLNGRGYESMLEITYRLNQQLNAWPSKTFYDNRLRPDPAAAVRKLELPAVSDPWVFALAPEHPAVYLDLRHRNATVRSRQEAEVVVELIQSLMRMAIHPRHIGVISPFRAQGRTIRKLLRQVMPSEEALKELVVDTVERMQGQEREIMIVSMTTSNPAFAGRLAKFYFQPERLNVSITRPRTKLILVGSSHVLHAQPEDPDGQAWVDLLKDLLAYCTVFDISQGKRY